MWFKKPMPVETLYLPVPSRFTSTLILVSLVFLSNCALRIIASNFQRQNPNSPNGSRKCRCRLDEHFGSRDNKHAPKHPWSSKACLRWLAEFRRCRFLLLSIFRNREQAKPSLIQIGLRQLA